jgi:uncharacterized membrane protein
MNPSDTQGKDTIHEVNKAMQGVIWMTNLLVWWVKHGKRIFDLLTNLTGVAWLILLLVGIWSDGWMHIKVAFTILIVGTILLVLLKAVIDFTKKPALKKEPAPPMSEDAKNIMMMSIIMDKWKSDPDYQKSVTDKFFNEVMAKEQEVRPDGESEKK